MTLQLSCKPSVYFFLRKVYGEKMKLGEYDTVSTLVFNTLLKNRANAHHTKKLKNYTCFYPIYVTNYCFDKYSIKTFTPHSIRIINKYIDTLFEMAFFLFVLQKLLVDKKETKTIIEEFMMLYDIDEDIYTYAALKKDFARFEKGEKKNMQKLLKKIPVHLS